jgi:hypothetical protein
MKEVETIVAYFKVTVAIMGWAHKATLASRPFLIYCASPSDFWSFLIRTPELFGNYQQRYLLAEQEKFGEKWSLNFVYEVSLSYLYGSLT